MTCSKLSMKLYVRRRLHRDIARWQCSPTRLRISIGTSVSQLNGLVSNGCRLLHQILKRIACLQLLHRISGCWDKFLIPSSNGSFMQEAKTLITTHSKTASSPLMIHSDLTLTRQ